MEHSAASRVDMTVVVVFGSLWGGIEASLGYGIHLLRRVVNVPGLSGYLLFPIGFFLMASAVAKTHKPATALYVAVVAAAIKAASGLLPAVHWAFVVNPVLAILAEGAAVCLGFAILGRAANRSIVSHGVFASFVWRPLFLLMLLVLPVQKGLLMRGAAFISTFVFLDAAVNAVLIIPIAARGLTLDRLRGMAVRLQTPRFAAAAFATAVGVQLLTESLSR